MHTAALLCLLAVVAAASAVGQYYVPRAYYTIDPEGHASYPVPLRRLRRSLPIPYGYGSSSNANANAHAVSNGFGVSSANANARSESGSGAWAPGAGWVQPGDTYMHPSLGYYNY